MVQMKVKVTQSCLTLCHPMDYTFHGILQARILEWVPFPYLGDLPNPGIEPGSLGLWAGSLPTELSGKTLLSGKSFVHGSLYGMVQVPLNK